MAITDNERRDLYRKMINDPATMRETRKYSFTDWENKLVNDEKAIGRLAQFAVSKNWALDEGDFVDRYAPELKAPPAPKQQVSPVAPTVEMEEEEAYIPTPQPAVGSPEYDAQLQMQYGGMSPTLGATFGGVPAAFETKAQKKQEQISPAFKAQQLAFEDVPIAEEQRRAQRQFAKATKEQQQAAVRGGTGFELQQEKRRKERGYGEATSDLAATIAAGGKRIGEGIVSTLSNYINGTLRAGLPEIEATESIERIANQELYNNATKAQNAFQEEVAKRNIQTSVLQAIEKGEYGKIPEAALYTIGDAAMQIIPSILTMGGSTYFQTLPQAYKDGVDAIAKEEGLSPEQVVASGKDAKIVAQISSGIQSGLEFAGANLVSSSIASRGGYKVMRDWLLGQGVNRNLARGASLLGVGVGEGVTEYLQEGTGQAGAIAAKSPTTKAFFDNLPKELFTPEAKKQRREAFVGGLVGGMGVGGGGQAIQSAMDRTLFEAPVIGKASQRPDASVVMTDDKLIQRTNLNKAMESAIQANPEAEGQIRERYRKLNDALELTDDEVVSAYDGIAQLPDSKDKDAIRERLEQYMAEKGIQPEATGMEAGLGELARQDRGVMPPVIQTVNADFPAPQPLTEEAPVEPITQEEEDEDLLALQEQLRGLVPQEEAETETVAAEEVAPIAPLNIDFTKNEGRNVNYQGIEGRIKIDSDGAPYVFTKEGDVVYIEGGLSGQTPQQLGVQPLADDVINEADVEVVLQDENAPLDQNQLQYDFDNNTVTLYGRPFTYEGVETNSKGQTTALRLRDANGKVKFVRNEDMILEFEIQKELYEKSRTNKPLTVESATAAAEQLQVVPATRPEQVSKPVQQERPVGNIEGDEVVSVAPAPPAPKAKKAAPAPKQEKKEAAPIAPETKPEGKTRIKGDSQEVIEAYEKAVAAGEKISFPVYGGRTTVQLDKPGQLKAAEDGGLYIDRGKGKREYLPAGGSEESVIRQQLGVLETAESQKQRKEAVAERNKKAKEQEEQKKKAQEDKQAQQKHDYIARLQKVLDTGKDEKGNPINQRQRKEAEKTIERLKQGIAEAEAADKLVKGEKPTAPETKPEGKAATPETKTEVAQEPRAAQKIDAISPTNLQVFKGIVTKDLLKIKMQGVYFDKANKKIVATDGMNMLLIDRDVKSDVIIDPKSGQVIKETFPDYQSVIPTDYTKGVKGINIKDLIGKLDDIIKGDKERPLNAFATLTFDGEEMGITPKVLKAGLKALKELGYETATIEYKAPNKPLLIKTRDGKTLLLTMPTSLKDDVDAERKISIGEYALEDIKTQPRKETAKAPSETKVETKPEAKQGFTEGKELNRIYAETKAKYGDKKAGPIFEVATRLVNPNQNTIIEIRSNGVVVKEGGRYLFKPFTDTDLNQKKWRLGRPMDISEQFEGKPAEAKPTTETEVETKPTEFGKAMSAWESNIEALINPKTGLGAVITQILEKQQPLKDEFLKRKGLTIEDYEKLSDSGKEIIQKEWVKSPEFKKLQSYSTPSLASQVEEMRTLPPAKRKAMQESLEAQYGKEEVAKMIEITANFTKIIDDLEEKGIVKKDCP